MEPCAEAREEQRRRLFPRTNALLQIQHGSYAAVELFRFIFYFCKMNNIRQVQALNKRELENAVYVPSTFPSTNYQSQLSTNSELTRPPAASWHADYRDTAYIYIGGLPFDLSEGDVVTICSQFGEPVHVNLVRDKETGKSRGFAFLKYEDQRSTDLAVDNLGGATVLGRLIRVDHVRYKRRDDEEEGDNVARLMGDDVPSDAADRKKRRGSEDGESRRPLLKEERELAALIQNHDDEDPMKEFLVEEKKAEVTQALERMGSSEKKSSRRRDDSRERSSRHHRHHRRRRDEDRVRPRSRSKDRRRRVERSQSGERRSYRDKSPSKRERPDRDRSPGRSQSPGSRRHRDRHDRRR